MLGVFFVIVAQVFHQQTSYSVMEEDGEISVCVNLVGSIGRDVEVILFTEDGTAIGKSEALES